MDYLQLCWCMMSVLLWSLSFLQQSQGSSFSQFLSSNSKSPKSSKSSSSSLLSPSSSSSSGGPEKEDCCLNGGLCVLGAFCHCPENYFGFRCEFQLRDCGPIQHGQWARVGCNLCRCFDANLTCLHQVYSGCDNQRVQDYIDINDYQDDMEIFPPDNGGKTKSYEWNGDQYYYYYDSDYSYESTDYEEETSSPHRTSSASSTVILSFRTFLLWTVPLLIWWITVFHIDHLSASPS